jgi:hypothetical protein
MLLGFLSHTAPSKAQGFYVEGQLDCGQWVEVRTKGRSQAFEYYVIGVLNGLTLGHGVEFWQADGRAVSRGAVYLWLDNYCRNHPLDSAMQGIVGLYSERSGWNRKQQ